MKKRMLSIAMALAMMLSLLPVTALATEPKPADGAPTASGTNFFANGTPITITADAPSDAEVATFNEFTATGESAYISWDDSGTKKYIGVDAAKYVNVFGGADGRPEAVSVESTSITMTGGTIWRLFGGNCGEGEANTDFCSVVKGAVNISLSGTAVVKDLLHGAGARNTCVNGTITMEFDGVDLSDSSSKLYVNGGSWGNGNEGTRNIADGAMETKAVANKVIITAKDSKFYLLGGGGSGSTKVRSSSVTLNNCTLSSLYLGGINGEVEDSSIVATDCTIEDFSATNRGFVGTANVDLNDCTITKLNTGAANGCFSSDSGGVDGSGVTGRCVWDIDADTTVEDAQLTPLVMKNAGSYTNTYENLTVQKAGTPLELEITAFVADENSGTLTQRTFAVPEGSTLTLKGVNATVTAGSTLTNVGTIDMDDSSRLTVASGATFRQLGTVNGDNVVINEGGTFYDDYVARIGTTGYDSLQDAVNAVTTPEPATITLLKDTAGAGVVVDGTVQRNLTFDLGGHTYTITSGVGSPGTETNGFQLIKDNNITFKNGTIAADPAEGEQVKILIQNYSNLTLDKVTLDGKNLNDNAPYTLSNNCGNVVIKDSTIIAKDGGCAFDVYYWPGGGYEEGVSVTVEGDSVITGRIEYGSDNTTTGKEDIAENAFLNIKGGSFTGSLYTYYLDTDNSASINITGGTFQAADGSAWDVSAYVQHGMMQDSDGKIVIDTANAVAEINGVGYTSLTAALAAAKDGDTIKLLKDLESTDAITIPAGVTIDGKGNSITCTGKIANGAFITAGNSVTLQNLTINTNRNVKHGVQFYCVTDGKLDNVTVNGGSYTSVIVNGSTVEISDSVMNPDAGAYANIEFAMGQNVTSIPELTLSNVTGATDKPLVYADKDTADRLNAADDKIASDATQQAIADAINQNYLHGAKVTLYYAPEQGGGGGSVVPGTQAYTITFDVNGGNALTENTATTNNEGKLTTLPEPTRANYIFTGWYTADNTKVTSETVFTATATLTAQWSVISSGTSYAITVEDSDNGTVTASRTRANKGLTVTLTVKADEGYKLDTITVTDKNGNEIKLTDKGDGKYTFAMPASAVTVKASFAKDDTPVETGLPFTDVKADDWFYEAVKYAYDNKLMDGTSSTTFAPLMTTNRAMIVTILWRLEGSPVVNYAMNFSDVESGVWYTEAVRWAAAEGIVKGYSDTVFAPDDTVTREQLATILYRYAEYKEYDVSAKGDLTTFADGSTVSTWAADGMTWAVGAQLITGKDGGKLDPTGTATRAEVATILMRFCENVAK